MPPKPLKIVILTGAGISKESGLSTFRDADGIWATVRVEDVATPEAFARDPEQVHAFYNWRRRQMREKAVEPNSAHLALAKLERGWPGDVLVVTQNVDALHEKAGTQNLIHMHGEHAKVWCMACEAVYPWADDLSTATPCEACGRAGLVRPNVVWFGETPRAMDDITTALAACDVFISIGTSGNVYPAAGFVRYVREMGRATTVELNLEPSEGAPLFDESDYGPATQVVPRYVDALLAGNAP